MDQNGLIEVELKRIIIDESRPEQVVVLKEKDGDRVLPIVIGSVEAAAIKMEVSGIRPLRPMTHDLLRDVFSSLNAKLERVVVDSIEGNTFYAKLHVSDTNSNPIVIDARPSDSIALALRTKALMFIREEVLNQIGINEEDSEKE